MTSKSVLKRHAVQNEQPVLTADKMREDFEALFNERFQDLSVNGVPSKEFTKAKANMWYGYKAATEQSSAKIAELQGRIDELVDALELLRDNQNGCPLPKYEESWNEAMRLTDEALAKVKDEK